MFVNPEVAIDSLPAAERVAWRPLDSRYLSRVLVGRVITWLIVLCAAGVVQGLLTHFGPPWATQPLAFALLSALLCLAALRGVLWPFLSVPRCGYAVRDKDILYKSGVLWRTNQVVPFNRVQHAINGHTPLDRYFHLATLTVYTAGGAGDLSIPGLGEEVAERLRVYIVGKLPGVAEAEASANTSPRPEPPAGGPLA